MEDPIFNELLKPDTRCKYFNITPQTLSEKLEEIKLNENLPKEVLSQLKVCKKLCLYSYFVYEFATVGLSLSFLAIETALKERLRLFYPDGFDFKRKVDRTIHRENPLSLSHFQSLLDNKDIRIVGIEGFFDGNVNLADLIDWAISKEIFKEHFSDESVTIRNLRNATAHPINQTILPPWNAIHGLSLNVNLIHSLFMEEYG
jgi:hypothetical protein